VRVIAIVLSVIRSLLVANSAYNIGGDQGKQFVSATGEGADRVEGAVSCLAAKRKVSAPPFIGLKSCQDARRPRVAGSAMTNASGDIETASNRAVVSSHQGQRLFR
jgi:hypothetical protein